MTNGKVRLELPLLVVREMKDSVPFFLLEVLSAKSWIFKLIM